MESAQLYSPHGHFAAVNGWPAYPHSYHGTPSQEHADFAWSSDPMARDGNYILSRPPMGSFDADKMVPAYWAAPVALPASFETISSTHASPELRQDPSMLGIPHYIAQPLPQSLTTPPPRRTLTDEDRRNMCIYAEENPTAKQTEIGAKFKVDRSTVSKVLRNKDKYMSKDKASRSAIRKTKTKRLDIEKALTAWAMQLKHAGNALTDEAIQLEGAKVASSLDSSDSDPTRSPTWLGNFKQSIINSHDRKDSGFDSIATAVQSPENPSSPIFTLQHDSRSVTPESIHDLSPHLTPFLTDASIATTLTPAMVFPGQLQSSPLSPLAARRVAKRNASPAVRPDIIRRKTEPTMSIPTVVDPEGIDLLDYSFLVPSISDESTALMAFPPEAILRSNSTDGMTVTPVETFVTALPSPAATTASASILQRRASDPSPPSLEAARSGLDLAWRFLQARKSLNNDECVTLGRIMERLKD